MEKDNFKKIILISGTISAFEGYLNMKAIINAVDYVASSIKAADGVGAVHVSVVNPLIEFIISIILFILTVVLGSARIKNVAVKKVLCSIATCFIAFFVSWTVTALCSWRLM